MPARTVRAVAASAGLALALGGCAFIGDFPGRRPPPVTADLLVYNRTEDDIFLVAADGERLSVPACGDARDASFRIDQVRVRTDIGYIRGFGMDLSVKGHQLILVEIARSEDAGIPVEGPIASQLPPCQGHPQVQPGV